MNGWKKCKLGDIAQINMGQSPVSKYYNDKGLGLPFLQGNRTFGSRFPHFDTYCSEPKKIANAGEILFSVRAPVGDINIANEKICIGRGLCSLKAKNGENTFLFYLLHFIRNDIINAESGTVFGSVNKNNLETIGTFLPPLPEQRAIASVLSSLDDKIDLLHRQNRTLEAIAETLFRQWFLEEAETSIIKLGDIIEIHDSKRIPLSSTERDKMKDGLLYPYYGAAKIMDYINQYIFNGEYLLLGEDGTVQTDDGFPILQLATGKYWVNNHTHVIQAKKPFTNFLLYTILRKTSITHIVTGAVQPKINQENLNSLEIEAPSEDKIAETTKATDILWNKMQTNNKQIHTLEKLRDTLLPKLMSGEVRVEV